MQSRCPNPWGVATTYIPFCAADGLFSSDEAMAGRMWLAGLRSVVAGDMNRETLVDATSVAKTRIPCLRSCC